MIWSSTFHPSFALELWANHLFLTLIPTHSLSLQSTCDPILDHCLFDSNLRSLLVSTPGSQLAGVEINLLSPVERGLSISFVQQKYNTGSLYFMPLCCSDDSAEETVPVNENLRI